MVDEPCDVAVLDRSELIAELLELRRQRSMWAARIQASMEREILAQGMVADLGEFMAKAFFTQKAELDATAEKAANILEMMRDMMKKVEAV